MKLKPIIILVSSTLLLIVVVILGVRLYRGRTHGFLDYRDETEAETFITQLLSEPKPSVVLVTATWAPPFKTNVEEVFLNDPLHLRNYYSFVRLDMTTHNEDSEQMLMWLRVTKLPAIVFIGPRGNVLEAPRFDRWATKERLFDALRGHTRRKNWPGKESNER